MGVSQPANMCLRARGLITVFIQHLMIHAEILSLPVFVLYDMSHCTNLFKYRVTSVLCK